MDFPKKFNKVLFNTYGESSFYLWTIPGQLLIYFRFGGLFAVTGGRPKRILLPIFIKGLYNISSIVNLFEGLETSILFIRSIASGGA